MNDQPTPARDFATNALRGRSLRGISAEDLADDVMHAIEQHYVVIHKSELRARDEAIIRAAKLHITGDPYIDHVPGPVYDQIIAAAEQEPAAWSKYHGDEQEAP